MKFSSQRGYLRRRGTYFRSWTIYYVVLSGWYLYFYLSDSDNDFEYYVGIKNAEVTECQNDIGVSNSFKIRTQKQLIYL